MEKDEYLIDENCKFPHKKIKVDDLDIIETIRFFDFNQNMQNDVNEKEQSSEKKSFYIIGGIHGDEIQGIRAAESIINYLTNSKTVFATNLKASLNLTIIPIINKLGYLAGLRNSPSPGVSISMLKEGKIYVEEKEVFDISTFSMKILRTNPEGWTDPNRLWEDNKTLVKLHLEKVVEEKPDYILFLHDWADYYGGLICYGDIEEKQINPNDCLRKIFEKYELKKKNKDKIEYFSYYDKKKDSNIMGWHLIEKYGICNFTLENFAYSEESQKIHFAIALFILGKISQIQIKSEDLVDFVIKETEDFMNKN